MTDDLESHPVIGAVLIAEAARLERRIRSCRPAVTAYERRQDDFLRRCADAGLAGTSLALTVAFRCGYHDAAADPIELENGELASQVKTRKQTFIRLRKLAAAAWAGIEPNAELVVSHAFHEAA